MAGCRFKVCIPVLNNIYTLTKKTIISLKENGVDFTILKVKCKCLSIYQSFYIKFKKIRFDKISDKERQRQVGHIFLKDIKISILVPLYNTPEKFLHEMIESVQKQTYSNWELCMADGSDDKHKNVMEICEKYCAVDKRIKYKKLEKNLGISLNTNECIKMATGEYIALFDHDDIMHQSALFYVMEAVCENDADFVYTDEATFESDISNIVFCNFKPDFAPDTLRSYNYICHLSVFAKKLLDKVGWLNPEFDGSQDYDLILRLTEQANNIVHVPQILYFWRSHPNSVAKDISAKSYCLLSARKAIASHLKRKNLSGEVYDSVVPSTSKLNYQIEGEPLISIIIPNKDHVSDLSKCIASINNSTYKNHEIVIVENNSEEQQTHDYYKSLEKNTNIKIINYKQPFNFSAVCNFGVLHARGDQLLFLNNDTEAITPNWMEEMLMFSQREDVGAVGAMLYYPDDTVQHAGVILGIGGIADHSHKHFRRDEYGYASRLTIAQNLSAVTGACMMMRKECFEEVGGFDERLAVAFNDIDLCMKIRQKGYLIVFTPYAELYHYESKSRGVEDTPEKKNRFHKEVLLFREKWIGVLDQGDPYYNPNLTLERGDFSLNFKKIR